MDIAEFLTARYDEEAAALERIEDNSEPWRGRWGIKGGTLYTYNGWCLAALMVTEALSGRWRPGVLEHIVRYDPARAAADLAAKRRILARHSRPVDSWVSRFHPNSCAGCGQEGEFDDPRTRDVNRCPELCDLAAPYADHPDFDPAWTVDAAH